MDKTKREKLIKVGAEKLADSLMELSTRSEEAESMIERLTSSSDENIKEYKRRLSSFKRSNSFIDWRQSSQFSRDLETMLSLFWMMKVLIR